MNFNDEVRERSSTYNQIRASKDKPNINIANLIKETTNQAKKVQRAQCFKQKSYMIVRMSAHMFWALVGLWMFYLIEKETVCLAKWGYPQPFMVYSQDS